MNVEISVGDTGYVRGAQSEPHSVLPDFDWVGVSRSGPPINMVTAEVMW